MNILQLGLNVNTFDEEKKKRLQEFIALFDTLSKYDGKVYNPVLGTGLVEFNNSVIQTSKLLDELNIKVKNIGSGSGNSKAVKEQSELSLAVNEYKKNADQAALASAKLAVATSDQAKQTAALKYELSEVSKELIKNEQTKKSSIQAQIELNTGIQQDTQFQAENIAMKLQAVEALKMLAAEQDRQEAEYNKVWIAAEQEREALARVNAEQAKRVQFSIDKQLAKESKAAELLTRDYEILNKTLRDQANAYSLAYRTRGKNSPEAVSALSDYKTTTAIIGDINEKLGKGAGSAKLFGGALSSAFGQLRTLAYILPGIGIAGIFNLAFEAIGAAAEELELFTDKLDKQIKFETQLNGHLSEQLELYKSIRDQQEKLFQSTDLSSSSTQKRFVDDLKAKGIDRVSILQDEQLQAQKEFDEASKKIAVNGSNLQPSVDAQKATIETLISSQKEISDKLRRLDAVLDDPEYKKNASKLASQAIETGTGAVPTWLPAFVARSITDFNKPIEEQIKLQKSALQLQKGINDEQITNLQSYVDKDAALRDIQLKNQKVIEDERRKLFIESSKEDLSVQIEKNRVILSRETSTLKEREASLKNIENLEIRLHSLEKQNVLENISSTPTERSIAEAKANSENTKSIIKYHENVLKEETIFYQRKLKASTEISKNDIEENAIRNERIENNDKKSYSDRINALDNYITEKQKIQDLETKKDLQQGASKEGGKTSLLQIEKNKILSDAQLQKANIQAGVEKKVYDIVSKSLDDQLRITVENNRLQEEENKTQYTKELTDLNNSFEAKKIKYKEYKEARKQIDQKYQVSDFDAKIADDLNSVNNLSKLLAEETVKLDFAKNKVTSTKGKVDNNSSKGISDLVDNREYDKAIGSEQALIDGIIKVRLKLKDKEQELNEDRLKKQESYFQKLEEMEKEHAANRKAIEEGIYNLIVTAIDGEAQYRIDALERRQQSVDEAYQSEIDAVQKSSLSAKDKAALDVQLNEQKKESDKDAALQERKLKHDQAVIDRELTLAHIAWETEQAVMAAYSLAFLDPISATGLAIERGILGAIAAATVLATPIPSFATGVTNFEGGYARTGEDGIEVVKEPYKSPYLVLTETISYLPKGTDVIPIKESPDFSITKKDDGWDQTRWLAKQLSKSKQEIKNEIHPIVKVDMSTLVWAKQILGN